MLMQFDLYLQEPKEMFVFVPDTYDPFDDYALGESGLDHLLARVIGFWFSPPKVQTRVYLPPAQIQPDTQAKLRRAMQSFCDDALTENYRERREFIINTIIFGVVSLFLLMLIVYAQYWVFSTHPFGESFLGTTVSYGLDVLAWVALWTPVSAILLDWFPLFRRYQAYRTLKQMELTLHTAPPRQ